MEEPTQKKDTGANLPKHDNGTPPNVPPSESDLSDPSGERLFYNVIPQNSGGPMVAPTFKNSGNEQPVLLPHTSALPGKPYLKWVIFSVVAVVVGLSIYFGYSYYLNKDLQNGELQDKGGTQEKNGEEAATTTPEGYSKEWLSRYFQKDSCDQDNLCGRDSDPDLDGLHNIEEFNLGTDPNNGDSDQDGLADGDEKNVFGSNPLDPRTAGDSAYNDADFLKGGYSLQQEDQVMSAEEMQRLGEQMKSAGLHQPTLSTLGDTLVKLYGFTIDPAPTATSTPTSENDQSPEAKLDRDVQRTNTMKNISLYLVQYHDDNQTYPDTNSFSVMMSEIKPYIRVATRSEDPINKDPYVFGYQVQSNGSDFILSYYSESQGTLIKIRAADAVKTRDAEAASVLDDRRKSDLEMIRSALLLYSAANASAEQDYLFPTKTKLKTALVPTYLNSMPKDPETSGEYVYEVSAKLDSFTVKAALSNPATGKTGWVCSQDECTIY